MRPATIRRARHRRVERAREENLPTSPFYLREYAFPSVSRQPGLGFKSWRFGDAFALRSPDPVVDRLVDRSPLAGKAAVA